MAGMEEIEIHSKSYLVRWVNVGGDHTISWSIQPHKKSLNFGIFKHPGTTSVLSATSAPIHSTTDSGDNPSSVVTEKLRSIGLKPIKWIGKCEADKISQGTLDIASSDGGNYALVFDNTFSKQISKTATFVLLTYPTHCPPRSGHQVHHSQAIAGSAGENSPFARPNPISKSGASEAPDFLKGGPSSVGASGSRAAKGSISSQARNTPLHTGILQKRRRKRHQGFARRFFSLDFNTSTLSYYHDRNSSALRGAIPLTLAAIATNAATREISIDSGAEIWHLRAINEQDYNLWKQKLERAAQGSEGGSEPEPKLKVRTPLPLGKHGAAAHDTRSWAEVETLVEKVSTARDMVRRLAKDTDPKYLPYSSSPDARPSQNNNRHMSGQADGNDVADRDRKSFWKLRQRSDNSVSSLTQRAVSNENQHVEATNQRSDAVHDRLMVLLGGLNNIVTDFSALIERKRLRPLKAPSVQTRRSMESDVSEEFFDAHDGNASPLLTMHRDSDEEEEEEQEEKTSVAAETMAGDESSLSGSEERDEFLKFRHDNSSSFFPIKPKALTPLPTETVTRRNTVMAPQIMPPSLISFLRKNVGKDLSTISMPVSANEPISLLQRAAEQFEYSQLLDKAANATDALERLIYVTAFAISPFSNMRVKERSIRKPFNPMLGETFEMVRGDLGFRFVAEKVSHRPVQLAYQADSKDWSLAQSPKPTQKFWGKSAEIITEGKARLTLHSSGEHFSWTSGTSFLRNIIAGEKYAEPVGDMCIANETTGQKTVVMFKAGGMFSGRSEEVVVKAYDTHGEELPLGLQGDWTKSLQLTEHGRETNHTIWTAGQLVDEARKCYGFTVFAANLNEITSTEEGKLPPTDSRLRPDQRALENGNVDEAEELKASLEERQRERRKDLETAGESWKPRWFTKAGDANGDITDGDDTNVTVWKLNTGRDGYWEERSKGQWPGVVPVFKL